MVCDISPRHAPVAHLPHAGHGEHRGVFQRSLQRQHGILRTADFLAALLWHCRDALSRLGLAQGTSRTLRQPPQPLTAGAGASRGDDFPHPDQSRCAERVYLFSVLMIEFKNLTKPPKACRWFGQELFATCPQGERPWGGFEIANGGCSSHPPPSADLQAKARRVAPSFPSLPSF